MASKIHAALEEAPTDEEQSYRALRIAVASWRVSYLLFTHLDMWDRIFLASGKVCRRQGVGRRECTGDGGHTECYRSRERLPPSGNSEQT